jgi:hypothetical protein
MFGGVTTLQDNKNKDNRNMAIKLNEQSQRKQLPIFNLNQSSIANSKTARNRLSGFEAKPLTNHQPWF